MENYQNYVATPKLGFGEAVKKVLSNVTNIKGRSRRSEYWWYFLVVMVVNVVASMLFSGIPVVNNILSVIIALSMIAVTGVVCKTLAIVEFGYTYNLFVVCS